MKKPHKEFLLFEEISSHTAKQLAELLAQPETKSVLIRLNSPGGDAAAGIAMSNAIRQFAGTVTIHVEGLCASAATMLTCVAQTTAACNAMIMIHQCWSAVSGNAQTLRDTAAALDKFSEQIINLYVKKTRRQFEAIKSLLETGDCWFNAKEALDFGLIDAIGPALMVRAHVGNLKIPCARTPLEEKAATVWRNNHGLHRTYPTIDAFIRQCNSARNA